MELNKLLSLSTALFAATSLFAQGGGTARVQVIHNCADAAAASVDVWLNSTLLLDDFSFRTASPFVDAPAGVDFTVGVAPPNSTSEGESIYTEVFNLTAGETYVLVASGIVSPTGYNPNPGFSLAAFAGARETADMSGTNDVLVYHGCTDAPIVDVYEPNLMVTAVDNISYGSFQGYLSLPVADYTLQVRNADQSAIVATYSAPLQSLGLDGAALTVVASGFLDGEQNSGGPAFGLWAALSTGGALVELPLLGNPVARVQAIHNCADLAAATVDVYLNDVLLIDDFVFRSATPFIDAPATIDFTLSIAPSTSTSVADAIYDQVFNLADGGTYVVVASGIVSGAGYDPLQPFTLLAYDMGREAAASAGNTDVLVLHGATDAPTVDVFESGILDATAVEDISYGDFSGYLELPTADYTVQVRTADNTAIVATYAAPLQTLGLGDAAITVLASGFLFPGDNSDGPAFGLWAALASGGALVELPLLPNPTARVQVIHNSADAAAASVDVWLNDALLINDFAFRTASPFIDAPATIGFNVGIAPPTSTSASESIATFNFNLDEGGTYIITANGIVSGSGYTPATPFDLYATPDAREAAVTAGNTDILVFHGCTDAPTVDVAEIAVVNATLIDDISYGDYRGYLEVPADDYVLQVQLADGTPVVSYQAPLASLGLADAAITVLASGFLDPLQNSNGPGFGLWVALAGGGDLVELPIASSVDESAVLNGVRIYPNPAQDQFTLELGDVTGRTSVMISDASGRIVFEQADITLNGGDRSTIQTNGLANGSYQVTLRNADRTRTLPLRIVR